MFGLLGPGIEWERVCVCMCVCARARVRKTVLLFTRDTNTYLLTYIHIYIHIAIMSVHTDARLHQNVSVYV
jgi:hypothetical protein